MNVSLIPGLIDSHTEFFDHHEVAYQVFAGTVQEASVLPEQFKHLIQLEIRSNPNIRLGLFRLGIEDEDSSITKVYKCNYSACDNHPDIDANGNLGPREYVSCVERGQCPAEGLLCKIPFGLTKRQRDVVREIGRGLLDKEICDKLSISQDTLRNHKDQAAAKAGIERKTSLAVIAHQYRIV